MAAHRTQRQGDEVFCTVCHCRWEVDDSPPDTCTPRNVYSPTTSKKPSTKKPKAKPITAAHWDYLHQVLNGNPNAKRPGSN